MEIVVMQIITIIPASDHISSPNYYFQRSTSGVAKPLTDRGTRVPEPYLVLLESNTVPSRRVPT